jgi:hypothetical protein
MDVYDTCGFALELKTLTPKEHIPSWEEQEVK